MARRRATHPETIERKVYFYRVDCGQDESGRPIAYDPAPVLRHIQGLEFNEGGRYWRHQDGTDFCCWPQRITPTARLIFAKSRRRGFPQLELGGTLSPLEVTRGTGVAELTHVVFFPNNIVGAEFNWHGPRATALGKYFTVKAKGVGPDISLEVLDRGILMEKLRDLQDVRLLSLRVQKGFVDLVDEADTNIANALRAAKEAGNFDEVGVVLKCSRGTSNDDQSIRDKIRALLGNRDLRPGLAEFSVRGYSRSRLLVDEVDLLSNMLLSRRQVLPLGERSNAVRSDSAFEQIEAAYREMRPVVERAASIRLWD